MITTLAVLVWTAATGAAMPTAVRMARAEAATRLRNGSSEAMDGVAGMSDRRRDECL
jgi:hypothetical protein